MLSIRGSRGETTLESNADLRWSSARYSYIEGEMVVMIIIRSFAVIFIPLHSRNSAWCEPHMLISRITEELGVHMPGTSQLTALPAQHCAAPLSQIS
jgi:hypothetical protein